MPLNAYESADKGDDEVAELFTVKRSNKRRMIELLSISAPVAVELLFITLMGMVSAIMVSNIDPDKLGRELAAVNMIDSISNIIIALFSAFTVGSTIVTAQYIGKRDVPSASKAAAQSLISALAFSIIICLVFLIFGGSIVTVVYSGADKEVLGLAKTFFFIINFSFIALAVTQTSFGILRGSGNTRVPMLISIIMNIVNVVIGYILIYGMAFDFGKVFNTCTFGVFNIESNVLFTTPSFGVAGAATGLLIARFSGVLMSIFFMTRKKSRIKISSIQMFKPVLAIQKIILGLGFPTSIESFLFSAGKLITQIFIAGMGTIALSANSTSSSVTGLISLPGNALSTGLMIIIGQRIGAGEQDDVSKTIRFSLVTSTLLLTIMSLMCFPLITPIIHLYNANPDSEHIIRQLLYSYLIASALIWPHSFMTPAGLRATGDVKYTMIAAIASMWLFRIASGYLLGIILHMGVLGIWLGMYVDWIARSILFTIRLLSGKWKGKAII